MHAVGGSYIDASCYGLDMAESTWQAVLGDGGFTNLLFVISLPLVQFLVTLGLKLLMGNAGFICNKAFVIHDLVADE